VSRRGHYQGGHTVFSGRDTSWFGFSVPKWAKKPTGKKKPGKQFKPKKKRGLPIKPARRARPLPGIKPEPSRPNPQATAIHLAKREGRRSLVIVEFAAARRRRPSSAAASNED
jgi:hypothetical protein